MSNNQHNILVIDKDVEHLHTLFQYLETTQIYNVMSASSADMAALIIEKKEVDLAIIDWETLATAKIDLLQKLKEKTEENIPNIFMASSEEYEENTLFIKENANDFLPKPVVATKLVQIAQNILGDKQGTSLKESLLSVENKLIEQEKTIQAKEKELIEREAKIQQDKKAIEETRNQIIQEQQFISAQKQGVEQKQSIALEQKQAVDMEKENFEKEKQALENLKQELNKKEQNIIHREQQFKEDNEKLQQQKLQLQKSQEQLKADREKLQQEYTFKAEKLPSTEAHNKLKSEIADLQEKLNNSIPQEEHKQVLEELSNNNKYYDKLEKDYKEDKELMAEMNKKLEELQGNVEQKEKLMLNQIEELERLRNLPMLTIEDANESAAKYESLLKYVLPPQLQKNIQKSEHLKIDFYPEVNSLILGIENLGSFQTQVDEKYYKDNFLQIINQFHHLMETYKIEPVKSREGVYSFLQPLEMPSDEAAFLLIKVAFDLQEFIKKYQERCFQERKPYLTFSITLNLGSIIAGEADKQTFAYDIWGELNRAVNTKGKTTAPLMTEKYLQNVKAKVAYSTFGVMPIDSKNELKLYVLEKIL